jgi:hypothetical protein
MIEHATTGGKVLYWISYDLDKPGQDYKDLIARLQEYGAKKILKSDWLVENNATPAAIRDDLKRFLDKNDRIMVSELVSNAAWENLITDDQTVLGMFQRSGRK